MWRTVNNFIVLEARSNDLDKSRPQARSIFRITLKNHQNQPNILIERKFFMLSFTNCRDDEAKHFSQSKVLFGKLATRSANDPLTLRNPKVCDGGR